MSEDLDRRPALLVRARGVVCALPLEDVAETMRVLPTEPLAGVPGCVRGVSIIRGNPVPVVDLAVLLGAEAGAGGKRLVTLRLGERRVALAVDAVLGVHRLAQSAGAEMMPPLLQGAAAEAIAAIGTLDGELLVALRATRVVPAEVWDALATVEAGT